MIILGVDPGSRVTGFAVIERKGATETLIDTGIIRVSTGDTHQLRLKQIYEALSGLIASHLPDYCAVEMPVYGNNPQSMLKLGRVQATAMLAALNRDVPVVEYSPKQVKKSVTGNGNASKEQVRYMIASILSLGEVSELALDASDAVAVALCHAHRGPDTPGGSYRNWADFVKDNPDRTT
ncbi:MAG: crossover junction endodeoxyribonuclease RuvC [Bacteroidetes bacterium CG12_big_fil_rev_8_21_14_0_65_60_17]|nr:MAG: crossover junction endodeoxyribonuclease RuvC [Bacteroidetes bacterium CG12_big_fil_rev_8_21_14_0_65_60_17]